MTITINDVPLSTHADITIAQALQIKSISTEGIALALNGMVIPKTDYDSTTLRDGDAIIVIKAFYGG